MSDHTPEIAALLETLVGNWMPDADDPAEAPIVDCWEFKLAATGRQLQLTGKVVGSHTFPTGDWLQTSAVAEVSPGHRLKWVRTQNTLYRLGWPSGYAWPPVLQVAANHDWAGGLEAAGYYTGEHTLPSKALGRAGHLESGKAPDWQMWRADCNAVGRLLKDAGRADVASAWWLLGTDLISERDRGFAETLFVALAGTREMSPEERSAISGWNTLSGCTDESIHDYGDLNDPIAAAHRAAAAEMEAEDSRELARRDASALPFFVALEPNHQRARQRVMEAVRSVLRGDDVGDLVVAADVIADQEDDVVAAKLVPQFIKNLTVWGLTNNVKLALSDHELHRALLMVSVASGERMHDLARIKSSVFFIRVAADEAVDLGLMSRSQAQLTVCAWSLMALGFTAIGQDPANHPDDPFAMADLITDQLNNILRIGPSPFPKEIADRKAEAEGPGDGVVVLARIGGTSATTSGKEVGREFKKIVGKRLPVTPVPDLVIVRAALAAEFPHAMEQIDVILTDLAGADAVRLRPTLLVGEPGGGKSRLARRLAEVLKVGLHRFDAAGSSDNAFGGTPRRWSSGEHAVPLEAISRYEIANPIVLVDEIDKAGRSRHNGSLAEALMPFLEQETARAFPDPFVQSDVDLSHVSYILTANRDEDLPAPLKDRLRILRLPRPSIEHLPAIARGIVADVARERGGDMRWWPPLDEDEVEVAGRLWSGGSVRKLRSIVERILAYREQNPRH